MTKNRIGAILFLVLLVAYALIAQGIPNMDFDEIGVTPSTLPLFYSYVGIPIALLLLVLPTKGDRTAAWLRAALKLDWKRALGLLGLMLIYGLTIKTLGFILSTIIFLCGGFVVMGLKQPSKILLGAIPITIVFWAILTQLLGIYLDPGFLFR